MNISDSCAITREEYIKRHWKDGESLSVIARSIGVTQGCLRYHIKRQGIPTRTPAESYANRVGTSDGFGRKYTLNQQFFDTWTPEMAWVLGLLASDGSVHSNGKQFMLGSKDIDLIEQFYNLLEYNGPTGMNNSGVHTAPISSTVIVKRLAELGIVPHKTYVLEYPPVPDSFHSHFIRGYVDGDGCIFIRTHQSLRFPHMIVSVVSTSGTFMEQLSCVLSNNGIKHKLSSRQPRTGHMRWNIVTRAYHGIQFCNFIYQDSTTATRLARKYKLFTDYVDQWGSIYKDGPHFVRRNATSFLGTGMIQEQLI